MELASKFKKDFKMLNNLGNLYLATDNLTQAAKYLTASMEKASPTEKPLVLYNLGILDVKMSNFIGARKKLSEAENLTKSLTMEERKMSCLIVLEIGGRQQAINYKEEKAPDILEAIKKSTMTINHILNPG